MSTYTLPQVYQFALNAGFQPGAEAANATAIAYGESSFNDQAVNYNGQAPGVSTDYGLMQINSKYWPGMGTSALLGDPQTSMNDAYTIFTKRGSFADWLSTSDGNTAYASMLPKANAYASGDGSGVSADPMSSGSSGVLGPASMSADPMSSGGAPGGSGAYNGDPVGKESSWNPLSGVSQAVGYLSDNIQSGVNYATGGFLNTGASAIASIEAYTSHAFIVVSVVVIGLIFVAGGLFIFGSQSKTVQTIAKTASKLTV